MSFFNKKEDVIDIQLTQYGKHLLSKGKFKPVRYAFFDDDILYDGKCAGITETQNDVQGRIEETPYLKAQHTYSSRDEAVQKLTNLTSVGRTPTEDEKTQATIERHYSLTSTLGNSSLSNNNSPAWNINFLKGDIESSISHITGIKQNIRIPQIKTEPVLYTTQVKVDYNDFTNEQINEGLEGSLIMYRDKYLADDSYIVVDEDYLLIDVRELNADFENDNFDIEIFLVEDENPLSKRTSSLNLDGIGDYISIAEDASFSFDGEFSIDLHFKLSALPAIGETIYFFSADKESPEVPLKLGWKHDATTPYFEATVYGEIEQYNSTIKKGVWYNVKLTRAASDRVYLYLNKTQLPGESQGYWTITETILASAYKVGSSTAGGAVHGHIDDFKITSGADEDVQLLLDFDERHGSTIIKDSSDNDITCTAKGGAHIYNESIEMLTPLLFTKEPETIKDGILLDKPESDIDLNDPFNPIYSDPGHVKYWFDIYCDYEIEESIICANIPKLETSGGLFVQDIFNCPEKKLTSVPGGTIEEEEDDC